MSPRQAVKEFCYLFARGLGKEASLPKSVIRAQVDAFPVPCLGKVIPHFLWGDFLRIELIEQDANEFIVRIQDTVPVNIDQQRPQLVRFVLAFGAVVDEGIKGDTIDARPPCVVADDLEQNPRKTRQGRALFQNTKNKAGQRLMVLITIAVFQNLLERGLHIARGKGTKSRVCPYGIQPGRLAFQGIQQCPFVAG